MLPATTDLFEHGSDELTALVLKLRRFVNLSDLYRNRLAEIETSLQTKTAQLKSTTLRFRELEERNVSLLSQLSESQSRNMEIVERFRQLEQVHLSSSEKLAALQYRLDDRVQSMEEKQELVSAHTFDSLSWSDMGHYIADLYHRICNPALGT
eukprot:jgi/Hompol1/5612/HPOL_004575-RA